MNFLTTRQEERKMTGQTENILRTGPIKQGVNCH